MYAVAHHAAAEQHVGGERQSASRTPGRRRSGSPARAICAIDVGVPPDVEGVDDDADRRGGSGSARSSAWPSVESTARSAQYIGCSGSRASRTPCVAGVRGELGERVGDPLARAGRSRESPVRQAADHQHQRGRAERRGLLDRAPVVVQRAPRVVGAVRKPPRHSEDTRSPASRDELAALLAGRARRPARATGRSPGCRPGAAVDGLGARVQRLVVHWLSDSRAERGVARSSRHPSTAQERAHPVRRPAPGRRAARPRRRAGRPRPVRHAATGGCRPPTIVNPAGGRPARPGTRCRSCSSRSAPRRCAGTAARSASRMRRRRPSASPASSACRAAAAAGAIAAKMPSSASRVRVAVAADQLGVVEVVAGVEPDAVGQRARAARPRGRRRAATP